MKGRSMLAVALLTALAACKTGTSDPPAPVPGNGVDASAPPPRKPRCTLAASPPAARPAKPPPGTLSALLPQLEAAKEVDAPAFAAHLDLPFATDLGYDPRAAKGLELLKASPLALDPDEEATLGECGFVMSDRDAVPTFIHAYAQIYKHDLPVYVSADSILFAVHHSFETILATVEESALSPALERLLTGMRSALAGGAAAGLPPQAIADADVYLAVVLGLLRGQVAAPVAGGDPGAIARLYTRAVEAKGTATEAIFGLAREIDFSQLEPRGHYTLTPQRQSYFRAMMWLGRTDLRFIDGAMTQLQRFNRAQVEGAYALRLAMDATSLAEWRRIDGAVGAFVGEPDNMTPLDMDRLLADLGVHGPADLAKLPDGAIEKAVLDGGYGTQRIASQILEGGLAGGTTPQPKAFLLLGQRYVIDSHVFTNVVYDRANHGQPPYRMLPNPLDVAFAALGNDQAGALLAPELEQYRYAPDLTAVRVLADAHPATFWDANLYGLWLSMLRALSPRADELANPGAAGLPRVAATEPWGRRILSTQLASWTELRHDTILYAKQSDTSAASCEYPDAYVDPYPELWTRLALYATRGAALLGELPMKYPYFKEQLDRYFRGVQRVASVLEAMAKNQRTGAPHAPEHVAFINKMLFSDGCGGPLMPMNGWYADLFFDRTSPGVPRPLVADVHTQPTDEVGSPVGKVLHVATGSPRRIVVTVDTCAGARAYVGAVSSYYEHVTKDFQRLTDDEWAGLLPSQGAGSVPWLVDLVAH